MKVKIKGTDKVKVISPKDWAEIGKNGNASEYEIIERNTVWAAPVKKDGGIVETNILEVELEQWQKLLDLGARNNWKRVDRENNDQIERKIIPVKKDATESTNDIIELRGCLELTN